MIKAGNYSQKRIELAVKEVTSTTVEWPMIRFTWVAVTCDTGDYPKTIRDRYWQKTSE